MTRTIYGPEHALTHFWWWWLVLGFMLGTLFGWWLA